LPYARAVARSAKARIMRGKVLSVSDLMMADGTGRRGTTSTL